MRFKIPKTIDKAGKELAELDGLITARSWRRAAIVWAFTEPGEPGRGETSTSGRLSCFAFAKLDIQGLRSRETVGAYRAHWQWAIDQGKAQPVEPGDDVAEPDLDFPPNPRSEGGTARSAKALPPAAKAKLAAELLDDPDVEVAPAAIARRASRPDVARAIARNDAAREAVEEEAIGVRVTQRGAHPEITPEDIERRSEGTRRGMGRALGDETDLATDLLHKAAGDVAAAILAKEKWGVDFPEKEAEALNQLDRYLAAYRSGSTARLTDDDRGWLDTIGVEL